MELRHDLEVDEGSLMEALAEVPDPRSRHGRRYSLLSMLSLAVCAMLCGARSLAAIVQWGRDHDEKVVKALGFEKGATPCAATFHLLFKRLDREALESVLGRWFEQQGLLPLGGIAIDGKTLRGVHGQDLPGVHLLAAYTHEGGVVLGQREVKAKKNEISTVPQLLEELPLRGQVVTGDAEFTQRELCTQIAKKGGTTFSPSRTISLR